MKRLRRANTSEARGGFKLETAHYCPAAAARRLRGPEGELV